MKKALLSLIALAFILPQAIRADDYRQDFINALIRGDFGAVENIVKTNVPAMSATDKRLLMNMAINYSAGDNTLRVCELLLRYNIRPDGYNLYTAIARGRQDNAIQFLLRNGALPNGEILLLAMERQRFDLARQFIEAGVDVNYQYPLSRNNADGMTPLLYASKWGNLELLRLLVEKGANINMRDVDGESALSMAHANNNDAIVGYLTEHGAVESANSDYGPLQNTGISSLLNSGQIAFERGTYRLFNGTMEIRFLGNTNSGTLNYTRNGSLNSGSYRIENSNLTIVMENRSFLYRIDSNVSFSGNGEVWVRIGN
jgi:hypothetical protein